VAFWVAHPPRASCFTVHVPELGSSAIGDIPKILCTEEDLVLLRVLICAPLCNLNGSTQGTTTTSSIRPAPRTSRHRCS
jgi:hypothetical protein